MTDPANRRLKQWCQERPDLDTSGLAIINRISMLDKYVTIEANELRKRLFQVEIPPRLFGPLPLISTRPGWSPVIRAATSAAFFAPV